MSPARASAASDSVDEIATIRIELRHTDPLIWRQVEAPTSITLKVLHDIVQRVMGWLDVREASAGSGEQPHARRAMLERLAQIVARAPRHRRASVLAAAQRTRAALAATTGIGAERVMASLARSTADDDAWLRSAETFGSLHRADVSDPAVGARLLALVLLTPGGDATPG